VGRSNAPVGSVGRPNATIRSAMAKNSEQPLRKGTKVVTTTELRGVPAGTPGVVRMVVGLRWVRYRVDFANGESVGSVDAAQIRAAK
jgi:hypothetical protein